MAVVSGTAMHLRLLRIQYDLDRRVKPAEDSEDAKKQAGSGKSIGGGGVLLRYSVPYEFLRKYR